MSSRRERYSTVAAGCSDIMTTTGEERERGFDHTEIEPRWQRTWDEADVFRIDVDETDPEYVLSMFPYTSGCLHIATSGTTQSRMLTPASSGCAARASSTRWGGTPSASRLRTPPRNATPTRGTDDAVHRLDA